VVSGAGSNQQAISPMMRQLFRNTVISGGSLFLTSLMMLLVSPLIVRHWGLTEYGLIGLSRTFLLGFSGSLDLGVAEIVTISIARARQNDNWAAASSHLSLALWITCAVGATVALVLLGLSRYPGFFLKGELSYASDVTQILVVAAFANMATFPGLIADGVLKGVERFGILRSVELSQTLIYVAGVAVAAFADAPYIVIVYVAIGTIMFGSATKALIAWRIGSRIGVKLMVAVPRDARLEVGNRAWLITQSKLVGAAQGPLLPVLLSWLFGPRAVGIYDLLLRLPRAAKTILALLNVALLPVSTRIEEADATEQRRRLGRIGTILLPAITVPPLVICAALSRPILQVWVGAQAVDFWPWMAVMFMIPICAQYVSFGGVMALSHSATLRKLNRISILQLIIIAITVITLAHLLQERSFILGQAVAWAVSLPIQLVVLAAALDLSLKSVSQAILTQFVLLLPVLLLGIGYADSVYLNSLAGLAIASFLTCLIVWIGEYFLMLQPPDRTEIKRILIAARRSPPLKA
jgi:O-antigen/teichoic acid export membrane protein